MKYDLVIITHDCRSGKSYMRLAKANVTMEAADSIVIHSCADSSPTTSYEEWALVKAGTIDLIGKIVNETEVDDLILKTYDLADLYKLKKASSELYG